MSLAGQSERRTLRDKALLPLKELEKLAWQHARGPASVIDVIQELRAELDWLSELKPEKVFSIAENKCPVCGVDAYIIPPIGDLPEARFCEICPRGAADILGRLNRVFGVDSI